MPCKARFFPLHSPSLYMDMGGVIVPVSASRLPYEEEVIAIKEIILTLAGFRISSFLSDSKSQDELPCVYVFLSGELILKFFKDFKSICRLCVCEYMPICVSGVCKEARRQCQVLWSWSYQ